MLNYLVAMGLIFTLMITGIGIERLYRHFQSQHPELGPYRRRDGGCNCHCAQCDDDSCKP